jgi:hypothetical protein
LSFLFALSISVSVSEKKEVQEHWMIASCKLPQNDDWKPKHHQESMLASEREKEKRDDGIAELHGAMTQV